MDLKDKFESRIRNDEDFKTFISEYRERISREGTSDAERQALMQRSNPRYVLRNWMAQVPTKVVISHNDFQFIMN